MVPGLSSRIVSYVIGLDSLKATSIGSNTLMRSACEDIRLRMDGLFELKEHAVQFTQQFTALYTNGPAAGGGIRFLLVNLASYENFNNQQHAAYPFFFMSIPLFCSSSWMNSTYFHVGLRLLWFYIRLFCNSLFNHIFHLKCLTLIILWFDVPICLFIQCSTGYKKEIVLEKQLVLSLSLPFFLSDHLQSWLWCCWFQRYLKIPETITWWRCFKLRP